MHKIVYLPSAQSDLLAATDYLVTVLDAPKAAADLLDEFDSAVELYRTACPMQDEIRKVPIKNYVLYYAVFPEHVEIRRFLHGRRDRSKNII